MIPTWQQTVVGALGGAVAGVLAAAGVLRRVGAQNMLDRASARKTDADTMAGLQRQIEEMAAYQETQAKQIAALVQQNRDQQGKLDQQEGRIRELERFAANVARTAPLIGATVSKRGVLSVERGATILVVDDDTEVCQMLKSVLEDERFEVCVACDLDSAIACARERSISVAIIDLYLGAGKIATSLVEALRALPGLVGLQVIVMTGADDPATHALIAKVNPMKRINEPFDVNDLLTVVRTALAKASVGP